MILALLAIWFGYKKARDSGRNAFLWAVICGASYIGAQLAVALGIGAFMGIGIVVWGWPESIYDDNLTWVNIASIIAGIATILLIFRYLDHIPDGPFEAVPPPPTFATEDTKD